MILFFFFIHTWCLLLDLVFAAGMGPARQELGLVERMVTLLLGDELVVLPGWVGCRLCGDMGHAP